MNADPTRPLNVFFACTGVGVFRGGIESFFREAFDGLRDMPHTHITLFKGAGASSTGETRLHVLARTRPPARLLGSVMRRSPYVVEQLSSLPAYVRAVRRDRPDVIFSTDYTVLKRLRALRPRLGVPFRTLLSNGGPVDPPFDAYDHVHQVTPHGYDGALAAGEPPARHTLVPYGITVPPGAPAADPAARRAMRLQLGLPVERQILLSVGWISATHKRMDYLIREVAALPPAVRPFLLILGRKDDTTPPIQALADSLLGPLHARLQSVPYTQVPDYYAAADAFALASLTEGFGRSYLEALIAGLPVIAHDGPVQRYVLGAAGVLRDLAHPGALAGALADVLPRASGPAEAAQRREFVRRRFAWPALMEAYRELFVRAAATPLEVGSSP